MRRVVLALLLLCGLFTRPAVAQLPRPAAPPASLFAMLHAQHAQRADGTGGTLLIHQVHTAVQTARVWANGPADATALDRGARALATSQPLQAVAEASRVLAGLPPDLDLQPPTDTSRLAERHLARRAHDLAGRALLEVGAWDAAYAHLLAAEALALALAAETSGGDALAPHRTFWLAQAAFALGVPDAVALADRARTLLTGDHSQFDAKVLASRARMRVPEARARGIGDARQLLRTYPEMPWSTRLSLEIAVALADAGDYADARRALDAWQWSHGDHPLHPEADALDARLADAGFRRTPRSWRDHLGRGQDLRWERRWPLADEHLVEAQRLARAAGAPAADIATLDWERALTAHDAGWFADALQLLDAVEAAGGAGQSARERSRWRARVLSRLGRQQDAWAVLTAHYGSDRNNVAALQEWARDLGRWDDLRGLQTATERAANRFDAAFLLYLSGQHAAARTRFEAVVQASSGTNVPRALYWWGRATDRAGDRVAARAIWQRLVDEHATNFYGLLAASRLIDHAAPHADGSVPLPVARPGRIHWEGPDGPAYAGYRALAPALMDGFRTWDRSLEVEGGLRRFATRWGDLFPRARVALALHELGDGEAARRAFRDVGVEFRALDSLFSQGRVSTQARPIRLEHKQWAHAIDNRPGSTVGWWGVALGSLRFQTPDDRDGVAAAVARHTRMREARDQIRADLVPALADVEDAWLVRRSVVTSTTLTGTPMSGPTRRNWLLAYPRAYGPLLEPHILRTDVNPLLLLGLMIVESDMNPDSVSRADAYGLLQVIPRTGFLVAQRNNAPDFHIHSLLSPDEAIRYGIWYLDQLLVRFHQQEILAMVAYNAGPHQVQRWMDWRGATMDLDEFLETVPFDGARRYPQRILQFLLTYRRLYEGRDDLYIGNTLRTDSVNTVYF